MCCPECGSSDIDVSAEYGLEIECQECGWVGDWDELEDE